MAISGPGGGSPIHGVSGLGGEAGTPLSTVLGQLNNLINAPNGEITPEDLTTAQSAIFSGSLGPPNPLVSTLLSSFLDPANYTTLSDGDFPKSSTVFIQGFATAINDALTQPTGCCSNPAQAYQTLGNPGMEMISETLTIKMAKAFSFAHGAFSSDASNFSAYKSDWQGFYASFAGVIDAAGEGAYSLSSAEMQTFNKFSSAVSGPSANSKNEGFDGFSIAINKATSTAEINAAVTAAETYFDNQ